VDFSPEQNAGKILAYLEERGLILPEGVTPNGNGANTATEKAA